MKKLNKNPFGNIELEIFPKGAVDLTPYSSDLIWKHRKKYPPTTKTRTSKTDARLRLNLRRSLLDIPERFQEKRNLTNVTAEKISKVFFSAQLKNIRGFLLKS